MKVDVSPDDVVTRSADGRCRVSLAKLIEPGETVEVAVVDRLNENDDNEGDN